MNATIPFSPHKAISLWDMIQILAGKFIDCVESFREQRVMVLNVEFEDRARRGQFLAIVLKTVSDLGDFAERLECPHTCSRCQDFKRILQESLVRKTPTHRDYLRALTLQEATLQMELIEKTLAEELEDLKFLYVPAKSAAFFERDHLWGAGVCGAFPSAKDDIKSGGNCLAMELYTAAVFHFIRAAEWGLRAFASHMKADLKSPLEYAEWEKITAAISQRIDEEKQKRRGPERDADLEFYRLTKEHFEVLKDVWRNNVMHTRGSYEEAEATAVHNRVQDLMKRLSEKNITESWLTQPRGA